MRAPHPWRRRPQHRLLSLGTAAQRATWKRAGIRIESVTHECPDRCEICGVRAGDLNKKLALDHCHITGKFRGWLCCACNTALGMARDSPETLRRMAAYLESRQPTGNPLGPESEM